MGYWIWTVEVLRRAFDGKGVSRVIGCFFFQLWRKLEVGFWLSLLIVLSESVYLAEILGIGALERIGSANTLWKVVARQLFHD